MAITRRELLGGLAAASLPIVTGSGHAQQMQPDLSHLSPERRAQYEAMHARMMAAFTYERITVPGTQALEEWERLRTAGRGWPVIVGNDDDLERVVERCTMADPHVLETPVAGLVLRSPKDILAAAENLNFPADLQKWPGAYRSGDLRAPIGKWPSAVDPGAPGPTIVRDAVSGEFHDKVHIVIVPAEFSWEVPAYLRWGDWNACPPPEYHVAALRKWHREFGVDVVGVNGDAIDLRASRLPTTRSAAMALAREHYGYCPDIVDQGVGSLSSLAAILMASEWWYLWWD